MPNWKGIKMPSVKTSQCKDFIKEASRKWVLMLKTFLWEVPTIPKIIAGQAWKHAKLLATFSINT